MGRGKSRAQATVAKPEWDDPPLYLDPEPAPGFSGRTPLATLTPTPDSLDLQGQINVPIFPIDDLKATGPVPNTPTVWGETIEAVALMTGFGKTKPRVLRLTDAGELLIAANEPVPVAGQFTAAFTNYSKRVASGLITNSTGGVVYTVPAGFKTTIRAITTFFDGVVNTNVSYGLTGQLSYYLKWHVGISPNTALTDQYYEALVAGDSIVILFGTGPGVSAHYSITGDEIPL